MFIDLLKESFTVNTPIFTSEILRLFSSNYTRAYIFRLINKAIENNELMVHSKGVYYIPKDTFFGQSSINPENIAEKKYIKNGDLVYGVYAGLSNLNRFGISTQVSNTSEIVTNNETTRKRIVTIDNKEFIIRKSRCQITSNNYPEYTILQLFYDLDKNDVINNFSRKLINNYIKENNITKDKLFNMTSIFPASASKNLIKSGIINDFI